MLACPLLLMPLLIYATIDIDYAISPLFSPLFRYDISATLLMLRCCQLLILLTIISPWLRHADAISLSLLATLMPFFTPAGSGFAAFTDTRRHTIAHIRYY